MSDGRINCDRIKQVIKFEGIKFGDITPTDIDGCIEYHNRAVILLEYKLAGNEMPKGQRICLERIANDIENAGKKAMVMLCEHCVYDVNKPVIAEDATVKAVYCEGKWYNGDGDTVKGYIGRFIEYVDEIWMGE